MTMPYKRTYGSDRAIQSSDATTYSLELPRTGILSAITLRIRLTNGSTSGTERVYDAVDRISVVEGSRALHSYTGRQAYALASLFHRQRPRGLRTMAASGVQEISFLVPFGFSPWDPSSALDLARHPNLTLRVEYSPTISATTFTTGTFTISVEYHWWDGEGAISPRGHIEIPEIRDFTSAASGTEPPIALPSDRPLLGVLIFAREAAIAIDTDIVRVRLLEQTGGQELFNRRASDLMSDNHVELGLQAVEHGVALLQDADTFDTEVNFLDFWTTDVVQDLAAGADFVIANIASLISDRVSMYAATVEGSATYAATILTTALGTMRWMAIGRGLPHALYVPMHRWGFPETAYVPRPGVSPILEIEQGGAGAAVRVNVLQYVQ